MGTTVDEVDQPPVGVVTTTAASWTSSDRRTAALLAAGAVGCAAAAALLYMAAVRTSAGQQVEEAVVRGATQVLGGSRWSLTGRIHRVNAITTGLGVAVVALAALMRRRPRLAAMTTFVVVGSLATVEVLKHWVLGRPGLVPTDYARGHATFPSGHTAVGMVLAVVLLMVLPLRARPWSWVAVGLFGATFGVSTVLGAFHRPSDVVAAHLVVLSWALAGSAVLVRWRGSVDSTDIPPRSIRRPLIVLLALGTVAALGSVVMAVVVVVLDPVRVEAMRSSFFVLAVLALTAEAAFVTATLLAVFRTLSLDPAGPTGAAQV